MPNNKIYVWIILGSISELIRSPGEGNGNPFHYSCLEKSHGQWSIQLQCTGLQRPEHDLETNFHFGQYDRLQSDSLCLNYFY